MGPDTQDEHLKDAPRAPEIGQETAPADALRDAAAIAERARQDEEAASEAREEYRRNGLPVVEPDERIAPLLHPGERLHATRSTALLDITPAADGEQITGGTLYLTSHRLLLLGEQPPVEVKLDRIQETSIAVERLLLLRLDDGTGIAIEAGQPRLLRVQVAAALSAQRDSR